MKFKDTKSLLVLALILIFLLFVPILARLGSWNELKRWEAPSNTFGLNKAIFLSVEEMNSYFDVFNQYTTNRIIVSDGGYAFVFYFESPQYPSKDWLVGCTVKWSDSGVILSSKPGISITITKEAVIQQIVK